MAALTFSKVGENYEAETGSFTGTVNIDIEREKFGDIGVLVKNASATRYKLVKVFKGVCDINFNIANDADSANLKAKIVSTVAVTKGYCE